MADTTSFEIAVGKIQDSLDDIVESLETVKLFVVEAHGGAEPEPEPEPAPEPPPEEPPVEDPETDPSLAPCVISPAVVVDNPNMIFPPGFSHEGSYLRIPQKQVITGDLYSVTYKARNRTTFVPWVPQGVWDVKISTETMVFDLATVNPDSSNILVQFPIPQSLEDGWYRVDITSSDPGEQIYPDWFYLSRTGTDTQDKIPCWPGSQSYLHHHPRGVRYRDTWVPKTFDPIPRPLPPRVLEPFSDYRKGNDLTSRIIVEPKDGSVIHPNKDVNGIWSTLNPEEYYSSEYLKNWQEEALWVDNRDGPRGVGNVAFTTFVRPHSSAGAIDFAAGYRLGHITPEGEIITWLGPRMEGPPAYYGDRLPEEAADWSEVTDGRTVISGCWAFAQDTRTTRNLTPITPEQVADGFEGSPDSRNEGTLSRHNGPVRFFANDAGGDRVISLEFDAANMKTFPPRATGSGKVRVLPVSLPLNDPWTVEFSEYTNKLYVSDRGNLRILEVDPDTGAAEVLLQGDSSYIVSATQKHIRRTPVMQGSEGIYAAMDRIHDENPTLVVPEGLFALDHWLYYADPITRRVKRIDLDDTDNIENVCSIKNEDQWPSFFQIAVSDGTFQEYGTVFTAFWRVGGFFMYSPDGVRKNWYTGGPGAGVGNTGVGIGYAFSVGVGQGRAIVAESTGIHEISATTTHDLAAWPGRTAVFDGNLEWMSSGLWLAYGVRGFSKHRAPLPDDLSENKIAYLKACGSWINT